MNRALLLWSVPGITSSILMAALFVAGAGNVRAADNKPDDAWRFTLNPYIWLAGFSGTANLEPPPGYTPGTAKLGEDSYLSNLNFAGMINFEARKERWSIHADTVYLDFSDPNKQAQFPGAGPGGGVWTVKADTGLKGFVFESTGAYSIVRKPHMNFDVLAGIRYVRLDGRVALDIAGPTPAWVRSKNVTEVGNVVDPIVGLKGKFDLGKKWYLPYNFDIGGFGLDSDLTVQTSAGIHYRFADWCSLGLGYRHLFYDFGNEKRLIKDLTASGATVGLSFMY